jgi:glycine cleavage system H protein
MTLPENYLYTADHEWILVEGDTVRIGITEFAQSELGELVFVEMPVVGKKLNKGDTLCVVESTKAASDVYCPLKCEIASANQALNSDPTLVNSAPYTEGWLATLSGVSKEDIAGLLTAPQYQQLLDSRK